MNKKEFIKRRGIVAYKRKLQLNKDWRVQHRKAHNTQKKEWCEANPEKVKVHNQERGRKGGKHYLKHLKYKTTGIQGERNHIRNKHWYIYHSFKQIIAPDSQIHHEWVPNTADFRGVALVEKDSHQYGIIDVILILEGEITLFRENEIMGQG